MSAQAERENYWKAKEEDVKEHFSDSIRRGKRVVPDLSI